MKIALLLVLGLVMLATVATAAQPAEYGSWKVRKWTVDVPGLTPDRDGFKDIIVPDERIELSLASTDGRAQLVVFHQMYELQVYILWNECVDNQPTGKCPHTIPVDSWYDEGAGHREDWTVANSLQATFYPGLVNPLLRDLAGARQFKVRVVPFGSDYLTHTFDVTGLAAALHELDGQYNYSKTRDKPVEE